MNTEFFGKIKELSRTDEVLTAIAVEGSHAGERAIYTRGKAVYQSEKAGIFPDSAVFAKTGLVTLNDHLVYAEREAGIKKMVICGAGHVSIPIIRIARMIGMHVTCIDDRPQFADNARAAGADRVICDEFAEALDKIQGDNDTYFVIVTRGHAWDQECLRQICTKPHAYIGMMGSRRRVHIVKETLAEEGTDKEVLASVHSPIGLDIHSETPEEIAVSILAEVIQVKNQKKNTSFPEDIMNAILDENRKDRMILAVIVSRKGSAPREAGTKMLIRKNGTTINTIGGGCVEADVITKAREMLASLHSQPGLIDVDLSADEAAKEGEVCGGSLKVWLEEV